MNDYVNCTYRLVKIKNPNWPLLVFDVLKSPKNRVHAFLSGIL